MSVSGKISKVVDEFAPGIPRKGIMRQIRPAAKEDWKLGVQEHQARRAGRHFDLRISDPERGVAHSWAMRRLPGPGEKVLAIRQSDHTPEYMAFRGTIKEGYGAGTVKRKRLEKIEVIKSTPKSIVFNAYPGKDIEEFALAQISGDKWLLINKTPGKGTPVPSSKPKYREIKFGGTVDADGPEVMQGKLDGAHNTFLLKARQPVRAFSYRPSERKTGPIQHTDRVEGMRYTKAPGFLDDTVLRGETLAVDNKGRALPARELGGILNANVFSAREKLDRRNAKLLNYIFDVVKFQGQDYEGRPYRDKEEVLEMVAKAMPDLFRLPPTARTPDEKQTLVKRILGGKEPLTREGVVLWDPDSSRVAAKIKFKPEFDVRIRDVFGSKAKGEAGGFTYEEVNDRPISRISRVGTGFSKKLKRDMLAHPEKYRGVVTKVTAMEQLPSGALRAPAFRSWHMDKTPSDKIPTIAK